MLFIFDPVAGGAFHVVGGGEDVLGLSAVLTRFVVAVLRSRGVETDLLLTGAGWMRVFKLHIDCVCDVVNIATY